MKASRYIAAICSAICSLALWISPLGETVENGTVDFFLAETASNIPPKDIVIVAIDESSFANLSLPWPWPRSMHGELLKRLFEDGAAAVAFDVVFSEPASPESDQAFAQALRDAGNRVVLGAEVNVVDDPHFTQQILVTPLPLFTEFGASTGFINLPLDDDGFVRRAAPSLGGKESLAQAATRLLQRFHSTDAAAAATDSTKPVQNTLIRYTGRPRTISTVSYYQVLQNLVRKDFFRDKLVFVGVATSLEVTSKEGVRDHFLTPFSRQRGGYMAGVEIQANIAENLLRGNAIHQLSQRTIQVLLGLLALVFSYLCFTMPPIRTGILWLSFGTAACVLTWQGVRSAQLYVTPWVVLLPHTVSFLISVVLQYVQALQERNFIRRVFSTYLSPRIVERLIDQPEFLALGGEQIEGSVLFLDIVGFSLIAEQVSPQELVQIVNRCLGALSTEVFATEGMVDKFIGDSIMAVWGAPFPVPNHGVLAVQTALRMQQRIADLSLVELTLSGAEISIRTGICSGSMVAGNVGDSSYVNYTVLGSTVNIASRLESLCKVYGVRTLLSESTVKLLDPVEFTVRELDTVIAKGLGQRTLLFELQGYTSDITPMQREVNRIFALGRSSYLAGRFTEAAQYFSEALTIDISDGPSAVFVSRSEAYAESPPTDWDGVFRAAEK